MMEKETNVMVRLPAREWEILIKEVLAAEADLPSWEWCRTSGAPREEEGRRRDAARTALRVAMGRSPANERMEDRLANKAGCVLLVDGRFEIGGSVGERKLLINGRIRATLRLGGRLDGRVDVVTREAAEAAYQERRQASRHAEAAYKAARQELIHELLQADLAEPADFGRWTYAYGQFGGYFYRTGVSGPRVAANSAFVAAFGRDWRKTANDRRCEKIELELDRRLYGARY
ncbi:hypothetical protein COV06_01980 [Candidatus Uhrbacteria bacterium CG10_big_fil_rev_8_21_14_0_10_50_16]|uniref:Uncharacterized protein n=1 Tax=Candidatus Uhrbacteria bacterium CG10_big_fil_rev_8_21_14_0_10_50_16 TaxID=1975039 RepID=A0A2H0RMG2_9BACT|nr:MAG: hypothetical protein COV06_01980 [Candidatus Uhrbacteria bacterium CG10_big_fil_rev_8_21_14_0_10_50_16]